mmetsp:Transcript_72446/g.183371  ORF Transcript_72446/g.183371 Transcript_72446/m.183371 type:complete len:262 (+) Transcript_72446:1308-2093(+)
MDVAQTKSFVLPPGVEWRAQRQQACTHAGSLVVCLRSLPDVGHRALPRPGLMVRRLWLVDGRATLPQDLAVLVALALQLSCPAQLEGCPRAVRGLHVGIVVRGEAMRRGAIVAQDLAILLQNPLPVLARRVQAPHKLVHVIPAQRLVRPPALAGREAAVGVRVELPSDEVVQLADDAIAVEVVANVWHAGDVPRLLQFSPRAYRRRRTEPLRVTDLQIFKMALVLERFAVMLLTEDVVVGYITVEPSRRHGRGIRHPKLPP